MSQPSFPPITDTALDAAELLLQALRLLGGEQAHASGPPDRPSAHTRQALRVLLNETLGIDLGGEVIEIALSTDEPITVCLARVLSPPCQAYSVAGCRSTH